MPKGMAATRKVLGMSSAGVEMYHSSMRVVEGRSHQRQQEGCDHQEREGLHEPLHALRQHVQEQRQSQVLVAVERDGGTQHREPEEAQRGDLVDPHDGERENVAGDHARQQQDDDGDQQADEIISKGLRRGEPGRTSLSAMGNNSGAERTCAGAGMVRFNRCFVGKAWILSHGRQPELADGLLEDRPGLVAVLALPLGVEPGLGAACRGTAPGRAG